MIAAAAFLQEDKREHPNLKMLDSLHLTYPGFERDKREAEAAHLGNSKLTLGFDAAVRRIKVKQRAHEEQKSMQAIHRSHPNLVSLDALTLAYPGWQQDFQNAEATHNKNPNCDFMEILRKIQVKQLRFENDRSHYRLKEIDNLKLSYPGWKADLRNLEKFHFEEAFFLPGDSLFQSKLDGLKRRQQIYLRSQKVRANRRGYLMPEQPEEEVFILAPHLKPSSSYTVLATQSGSDLGAHHLLLSNTLSSTVSEDRSDRQATRAPYAVILGADSTVESARTPVDPPNRPDPPECETERVNHPSESQSTARQSVDCDEESKEESNEESIRGAIDCEEEVPEEEPEHLVHATKSDPQGISGEEGVVKSMQQSSCPSKLSSYIDLAPVISEPEESEETSEDHDEIADLPTSSNFCQPKSSRRSRRSVRPKGIYSAPPMPTCDDVERSRASRAMSASGSRCRQDDRSMASRAMSAATPTSSRAVDDTSDVSAFSQSSTRALWNEEASTDVSATSSRAVWTESPNPYANQTPSSIRTVLPMPNTPQEREHVQRSDSRGSTSERIRKTRCATADRSRRTSDDRSRHVEDTPKSRLSRNSKTNSKASSQGTSRSKRLGRCTICGDPDKNHVFVPCGHLCACKICAEEVITRQMACPVCRGSVTEAIQVFL